MNPKASLKSLKVKVRAIASRPCASAQPGSPLRADFRASADSRSAMLVSLFKPGLYPNTYRRLSGPTQGYGGGAASAAEIPRKNSTGCSRGVADQRELLASQPQTLHVPDEAIIFILLRQRRTSAAMPPAAPRTNRALAASAR